MQSTFMCSKLYPEETFKGKICLEMPPFAVSPCWAMDVWCDSKLNKRICFWCSPKSRWTSNSLLTAISTRKGKKKENLAFESRNDRISLHALHFSRFNIHFLYWSPVPSNAADNCHFSIIIPTCSSFHTASSALWITSSSCKIENAKCSTAF